MSSTKDTKSHVQKIKFEIIPEYLTTPELSEEIRWEDDGGRISALPEIIDESQFPLKPGVVFKVRSGRIVRDGQKAFYIADIETLDK